MNSWLKFCLHFQKSWLVSNNVGEVGVGGGEQFFTAPKLSTSQSFKAVQAFILSYAVHDSLLFYRVKNSLLGTNIKISQAKKNTKTNPSSVIFLSQTYKRGYEEIKT